MRIMRCVAVFAVCPKQLLTIFNRFYFYCVHDILMVSFSFLNFVYWCPKKPRTHKEAFSSLGSYIIYKFESQKLSKMQKLNKTGYYCTYWYTVMALEAGKGGKFLLKNYLSLYFLPLSKLNSSSRLSLGYRQ